jgi:hypothetical protein
MLTISTALVTAVSRPFHRLLNSANEEATQYFFRIAAPAPRAATGPRRFAPLERLLPRERGGRAHSLHVAMRVCHAGPKKFRTEL